jgi:hypothetical protein
MALDRLDRPFARLQARQLAAQALHSLQPLQFLTGCRALDLEPEDPSTQRGLGGGGGLQQIDSLRWEQTPQGV